MGMACNKLSLSDMNLSKTPSPSDLPSQLGEDVKMIWLQVFVFLTEHKCVFHAALSCT